MKRLLVVLLALGLAAGTIFAQDNSPKKDAPKQETKKEKCDMGCCKMDGNKKDTKMMKCDMKMGAEKKSDTKKSEPKK